MKTFFRKKPEMCLFQSVNYINILLLGKNIERLVFANLVKCIGFVTCKLYRRLQ